MLLISVARTAEPPSGFQASIVTVRPLTGSVAVPISDSSVSDARTSRSGERALNRAGKAICQ